MKENSFRFRESFGKAVNAMDDKQAGKFIKGLCNNVFDNKYFECSDVALKSTYILVKTALEADERNRENGRRGGYATAEKHKRDIGGIVIVANRNGVGGHMSGNTESKTQPCEECTDE